MPSIREKQTKDGRTFYEIQVSRGRSRSRLTSRWYPPEGWSQKAIDRELAKVEHHPCFELFYRNTGGFLFGKPCIAGLSAFYK